MNGIIVAAITSLCIIIVLAIPYLALRRSKRTESIKVRTVGSGNTVFINTFSRAYKHGAAMREERKRSMWRNFLWYFQNNAWRK